MINTNSTLIRRFLTGLSPLLMLTLLTSCQKDNPVVSKEPRIAARAVVGEYDKKPVQVSKPSATNITDGSARIEWNKARRAQEYIVTRRALYADNPESSLSPVHTTSGLSYDDTGLVPDTEYIYRIVARNNVGEAKRSSHIKFRTLAAPKVEAVAPEEAQVSEEAVPEEEEGSEEAVPEEEEVSEEAVPEEEEESRESSAAETESAEEDDQYDRKPAQVRKPSATDITRNSARIEWRQSSRAQEYIVTRRALYADDPESSLSPVHTTSELSYDDTDLVPDTEFIYRIVARNNVGEAQRSSHLKFRTLAAPVGTSVSAVLVGPEEPEGSEVEYIPEEEEEPLQSEPAHVEDHEDEFTCGDYDLEQYEEYEPRGTFPIHKRYAKIRDDLQIGEDVPEPESGNDDGWGEWQPTTPWAYALVPTPFNASQCERRFQISKAIDGGTHPESGLGIDTWVQIEAWICQASLCDLEEFADDALDAHCRKEGEICMHSDLRIAGDLTFDPLTGTFGAPSLPAPDGYTTWEDYFTYCALPGVNCYAEYEGPITESRGRN